MLERQQEFNIINPDILIYGDIHHHVDGIWDILKKVNPKKVIWLGDWNDSFGDSPDMAAKTGAVLRQVITNRPQDIFILSNHDISYRFPLVPKYHKWGFSPEKCRAFHTYFPLEAWKKFKLFHIESINGKKLVFSHAGFHKNVLGSDFLDQNFLHRICNDALREAHNPNRNPLIDSPIGPLWKRWPLNPLENCCQIVGHSPIGQPDLIRNGEFFNANFDCAHTYVGLIHNNALYSLNIKNMDQKLLSII